MSSFHLTHPLSPALLWGEQTPRWLLWITTLAGIGSMTLAVLLYAPSQGVQETTTPPHHRVTEALSLASQAAPFGEKQPSPHAPAKAAIPRPKTSPREALATIPPASMRHPAHPHSPPPKTSAIQAPENAEHSDCPPLFEIYFKSNQRHPGHVSSSKIRTLQRWLRQHKDAILVVQGHTDSNGNAHYNLILSFHRAHAVAKLLQHRAISAHRIQVRALGPSAPSQRAKAKRQRRVSFLVMTPKHRHCSGVIDR